MDNLKIVYRGLPFRFMINGVILNWMNILEYIKSNRGIYLEFDGWRFSLDYGILYIIEKKYWNYYIPPNGLNGKRVLDVGGGCGETAKYFLEHGAKGVKVIDSNPICREYLKYNSNIDNRLEYEITDYYWCNLFDDEYDLLKLDIEGYEIELLKYLDELKNKDIILESHCNYITDKFIKEGFKLINDFSRNKEIHGGVVQLCRWKR